LNCQKESKKITELGTVTWADALRDLLIGIQRSSKDFSEAPAVADLECGEASALARVLVERVFIGDIPNRPQPGARS
jgi:hypothetical protein